MRPILYCLTALALALSVCGGDSNLITQPTSSNPEPDNTNRPVPSSNLFQFVDQETGSIWNMRGEAVQGELAGQKLKQIPGYSAYWFAWSSFWPDTAVWGADGDGNLTPDAFAEVSSREYFPDVPRDAIPLLDNPPTGLGLAEFTSAVQATYLADLDIVIGVEIDGDARAYPVKILNWHEIVNHTVGGQRISLTYCPLTASGINFDATEIEFGNTGGLFNNNMVMYDRQTESFWSQMRISSILGERVGSRLELLPVFQGTWAAWRALYPQTVVLSEQTGYTRDYGGDFYIQVGYTTSAVVWFPQVPSIDSRFHPKTMVLGLIGDQASKAYPFSEMGSEAVINDRFDGVDIVVVFQGKAQAALAFDRAVNGANP